MVQQKPSLPIILDSPPPSILAYWRDNGYKLMKPLSVAVTRGWVGTQTLHHPVTLINQAPSSPPSLPPDWRTARGCNATLWSLVGSNLVWLWFCLIYLCSFSVCMLIVLISVATVLINLKSDGHRKLKIGEKKLKLYLRSWKTKNNLEKNSCKTVRSLNISTLTLF